MIFGKDYNARYFNGISAIPISGSVQFHQTSIIFIQNSIIETFSIDHFHDLEIFDNGVKLTFHTDENKESPVLEIICQKHESKEIERKWLENKKGKGLFESFNLRIRQLNPLIFISICLSFLLLFGIGYFYTLQTLYVFFPTSIDEKMGEKFKAQIEKTFPVCKSKEAEQFFEKAIAKLRPKKSPFKYKVSIINLPEENAISIAGGNIYFFSELLKNSSNQEEIIGVLAHEIAHIERRHHLRSVIKSLGVSAGIALLVGPGLGDFETIETIAELASTVAVLKYSRDFENEADTYSHEYLVKNNISTKGMLTFLKRVRKKELELTPNQMENKIQKDDISKTNYQITDSIINLLSSHPPTEDRIRNIESLEKNKNNQKMNQLVSKEEWIRISKACTLN